MRTDDDDDGTRGCQDHQYPLLHCNQIGILANVEPVGHMKGHFLGEVALDGQSKLLQKFRPIKLHIAGVVLPQGGLNFGTPFRVGESIYFSKFSLGH
jgi:hypothetical protein